MSEAGQSRAQVDHILSKDMFWMSLRILQAAGGLYISPILGKIAMFELHQCTVEDVDARGEVIGPWKIPTGVTHGDCNLLPEGVRLTNTQSFLYGVPFAGFLTLCIWNLMYMCIYKAKIPFIDQYKIEKDGPWPLDKDPEGWKHEKTHLPQS